MTALIACQLDSTARECLKDSWEVIYVPEPDQCNIDNLIDYCELLIVRSGVTITKEQISRSRRLRAVIRAGSGIDNIPIEALRSSGIRLYTIPGMNSRSVAELGIAFAISLLRNLPLHQQQLRLGSLSKGRFEDRELSGQVVGLLGAGHIARHLTDILAAFECRVLYARRSGAAPELEAVGAHYACIADIYALARLIFVQVPSTLETRHMINAESLLQMKKAPILINLGRWDVVHIEAVLNALRSGVLSGLAIDPIELSGLDFEEFANLNCMFTPHIGGTTVEAQQRVGTEVVRIAHQIATDIGVHAQ